MDPQAMQRTDGTYQSTTDFTQNNFGILTACIVIPTYNEAKNIAPLLDKIFNIEAQERSFDATTPHLRVLIVDDSSPDGTSTIIEEYKKKDARVHLLLRKTKNGLGAAYIAGMLHALDHINPDIIMEMDADGQHDPADIYRLLAQIRKGADFVIGSRYVEGGSVPASWGINRRIKSKCANFVTRNLLGVSGVNDCSGGYRAIRASILRKIDFNELNVKGYAFQAVLLEACMHAGSTVREVPIAFFDREKGESKMGFREYIEGFYVFSRIRSGRLATKTRRIKNSAVAHIPFL